MRRLVAILGVLLLAPAQASMESDGTWAAGVWAPTVWADNVWYEDDNVFVPDVVGLSTSAADTALQNAGLDTGNITTQCSAEPLNEVLGQIPIAGASVEPASLVDLVASTNVACPTATRRPNMNIGIGIGVTK